MIHAKYLKDILKWILFKTENSNPADDTVNNQSQIDIFSNYHNILNYNTKSELNYEDYKKHKDDSTIIVNWILPHAILGSGGHINIFRMVMGMAKRGVHNRLYFMEASDLFLSIDDYKEYLTNNFKINCDSVEIRDDLGNLEFAHATIATYWETAYIVRDFNNTISKFYFVQDFEPMFFAAGTKYGLAINTYKFGFRGITAGYWLSEKLNKEFGMETEGYGFSVDRSIYKPEKKIDDKKRIFMYARPYTERRAFDFGIFVLSKLYKRMPDVEIVFAGEDVSNYKIDFPYVNKGILSEPELPFVYSQCDVCIVFSMTNASLLPMEIMACNSVVLCNDDENNKWLTNEDNSILVEFDVDKAVDTIEYYLNHPDKLKEKRQAGFEYANHTSWEDSVEIVYNAIINGVKSDMEKCNFVYKGEKQSE